MLGLESVSVVVVVNVSAGIVAAVALAATVVEEDVLGVEGFFEVDCFIIDIHAEEDVHVRQLRGLERGSC